MSKEIIVRETAGIARDGEYVRVSLPCGRDEFPAGAPVGLTDETGSALPCQSQVLKAWPDGSAKWLLLDFSATVPAGAAVSYRVDRSPTAATAPRQEVVVSPGRKNWRVDTGSGTFLVDARTFRPFTAVWPQGGEPPAAGGSSCLFSLEGESFVAPSLERVEIEDAGPLHAILLLSGQLPLAGRRGLRFASRLHFFAGSLAVEIEFTLHNPERARHRGGLWDLGDPGSVLFKELAFRFELPASTAAREAALVVEPGTVPLRAPAESGVSIYQESSGGENWLSANHRNRDGKVPFDLRGYRGAAGREESRGKRATPVIWCGSEGEGISAGIPYFWQEFPKALEVAGESLKVSLFPSRYPDLHELQGGEQKTHRFALDFASTGEGLPWAISPLKVMASPEEYGASGIFYDLPGDHDLINEFCEPEEILQKREAPDEYGWRNFGELYADHEAVFHEGEESFVSHYNNQYDFIAGAYRKFFATGDFCWRGLAAELARHVLDIDIYHSDLDREEYNQGLFWHTDHHLAAGLSTHRSFSCEQLNGRDARFCGGGPGAEHCYTTGLMLEYFQTGDRRFKEAVLNLAGWVLSALEGSQTASAALKRGVAYLIHWRASKGGERKLFPRYPLTRGTGNAIVACLDAFELGGGRSFLEKAEELIRGAAHPKDDLNARRLLDAEIAWSYTVFLSALAKYLEKKRELGELDGGFCHARSCLLAYAEWMRDHEYCYLEHPELLEFPNETWAAQDLRKSVIMLHASRYAAASRRESFRAKGLEFFERAAGQLRSFKGSSLTRPLVLMLQNGWVGAVLREEPAFPFLPPARDEAAGTPVPYLSGSALCARIGTEMAAALGRSSLRKEFAWIRSRMAR